MSILVKVVEVQNTTRPPKEKEREVTMKTASGVNLEFILSPQANKVIGPVFDTIRDMQSVINTQEIINNKIGSALRETIELSFYRRIIFLFSPVKALSNLHKRGDHEK